jgi:SAM-dependent methyltransferase
MADVAQRLTASPNFTLVRERAETYESVGAFDVVLASMSLDHVDDVTSLFRRLAANLVGDGRVIITTEHPLRTASLDGSRWIDEGDGRAARVRDYGVLGWRRLRWFGRPEPVWVFHRTISAWVESLNAAGLRLLSVDEPVDDDSRDAGNPRFWVLVGSR